jgi:dCMP deaminase
MIDDRPTLTEYYFSLVDAVASRSTCRRVKTGAIAVYEGRILATGYNGAPRGAPHCSEHNGCRPGGLSCARTIHAEANVVANAALHGTSLLRATLYCTMRPCIRCSGLLVNTGIKEVIYGIDYEGDNPAEAILVFKKAGVTLLRWSGSLDLTALTVT